MLTVTALRAKCAGFGVRPRARCGSAMGAKGRPASQLSQESDNTQNGCANGKLPAWPGQRVNETTGSPADGLFLRHHKARSGGLDPQRRLQDLFRIEPEPVRMTVQVPVCSTSQAKACMVSRACGRKRGFFPGSIRTKTCRDAFKAARPHGSHKPTYRAVSGGT